MHPRHDATARKRAVCFYGGLILLGACAGPPVQPPALESRTAEPPYRIERHIKVAGQYQRFGPDQVQIGPYRMAHIDHEDQHAFYVRVYADAPAATDAAPVAETPPLATLASSQRYRLESTGAGLPRSGQWRNDFVLADLDGDGSADLAAPSPRKSFAAPQVYRQVAPSSWEHLKLPFPALPYDYGASAVADFDGDGQPDLALAMHLRGHTVLRQVAPGRFERMDRGLPPLEQVGHHGVSGVQLAVLPFQRGNGLLLVDEGLLPSADQPRPALRGYRHHDAGFASITTPVPDLRQIMLLPAQGEPQGPWLLGLDRPSGESQVWVWRDEGWHRHPLTGLPSGCVQWAGAVADVDGDAEPDVAVACLRLVQDQWWSEVRLLRSRQAPLVLHGGPRDTQVVNLRFAAFTSGSTQPDLVWVDLHGNVQLLAADGAGSYSVDHREPAPSWRAGCRGYGLHAADLDASGQMTLVAGFAGESSPFETGPQCVDGGGLDAWQVLPRGAG